MNKHNQSKRPRAPTIVALSTILAVATYHWLPPWIIDAIIGEATKSLREALS